MNNGWDQSAAAWVESMGNRGDWAREYVLDPAMLARLEGRRFEHALDVGCGEGRFCRLLRPFAEAIVGIDPTQALLDTAQRRDPRGRYQIAHAEALPFSEASFDLVVSYLTLIDIDDFRVAISEMARVLKPGGTLLIANINSFVSTSPTGWARGGNGERLYLPVDHYLEEASNWVEWSGIRIRNWHRPLSAYMSAFLGAGLQLRFFDEPVAIGGDPERMANHRRVPWFLIMEWQRS